MAREIFYQQQRLGINFIVKGVNEAQIIEQVVTLFNDPDRLQRAYAGFFSGLTKVYEFLKPALQTAWKVARPIVSNMLRDRGQADASYLQITNGEVLNDPIEETTTSKIAYAMTFDEFMEHV